MKKLFTKLFLLLVFFISSIGVVQAANYYWVGGAGNWSDLTHWATTSGGTTFHFIPPSPTDDVIFDANSGFTASSNIVTTNSSIYCRNMIWNNAPANPIFNESNTHDWLIYGSITLQSTLTFNVRAYFTGSIPATITSNGCIIRGAIEIEKGTSSLTLADSLMVGFVNSNYAHAVTGDIALTSGTFNLNGKNVYANSFYSSNNNVRHINMVGSTLWFKAPIAGLNNFGCNAYPYQNAGSNSNGFTYTGTNKTVAAANSLIRQTNGCNGLNISGGTQLTFHNVRIATSTSGYNSTLGNSIFNLFTTDNGAYNVTSTNGCQIDSLIFNTLDQSMSSQNNLFNGSQTTINVLRFNGFGTNPTVSYNGIGGSSNTIGRVEFRNYDGRITGNSNNIGYVEFFDNGFITGTNNTMGTLVFAPGYVYRLGTGTNNTITTAWFGSGNPCYLTELLNMSTSGIATLTVNTGAGSVNLDYIRVRGVIAAGSASPFSTGSHSLDLGNNTNWNFTPYDPGAPLAGLGPNVVMCPSLYPLVLNTTGFVASPTTTFTWYDGSTSATHSVNGPGTYWVSVDYGRGCLLTDSVTVTDRFDVSFSNHLPVCDPGNPGGSVTATAVGTSGPYTYSWNSSPVQTTATLSGVSAGTYTVTVTDAFGCSYSDSTTIVGPSTGAVFDVSIPAATVFPDCDPSGTGSGSAIASTTGGSTPYSLVWNTMPVQTTAAIFNLNAGTYKVVATDANGCKDSAEVVIINQAGAFTGSVAVTNPTGCNLTGSGTVTITGGLAPFSYVWSHSPAANAATETNINIGSHSVTVVDDNSCIANLPFAIVSPDNIAPTITGCPSNIIVSNTIGTCGAVVTWTDPTATDACGVLSLTSNHASGETFSVGTTNVVYTATDNLGNVSTCSFTVTVQDTEAPTFTICPTDRIVTTTAGNCSAAVAWAPPVATDNCSGVVSVIGDFSPGSTFPIGTTLITYVATDVAGNKDTCQFKVIVKAHPSSFYFTSTVGSQTAYTSWVYPATCGYTVTLPTPSIYNLCGNYFLVPGTYNPGQSVFLPVGATTITYKYTNGADTLTNTYIYTVIDSNGPSWVTGTSSISLVADTCGGRRVTWTPPVPTDNCSIVSLTSNYSPGDLFPVGSTTVSYIATDPVGYTTQYNFSVSISDPAPVISGCPSNISLIADTCGGRRASWTPPTASDNCLTSFTSNYSPGHLFPVGTTTVTYTAVSGNGAQTTCSFNVIINPSIPAVTNVCPSNITINLDAITCDTAVTWVPPTFAHPCGISTITSNQNPGDVLLPGVYPVTYTATSIDGFVGTCSFTITVNEFTTPVTITDCPANHPLNGTPWVTAQVDTAIFCGEAVAAWTVPSFSTSNCSAPVDTVIYTSSINLGDTVNIGQYSVLYEAFDDLGNLLGSCAFTFEVVDSLSGVFASNCPTSIIVQYVNPAVYCGGVSADFEVPAFESLGCAVAIDTVINNINPGDTLALGIHNITYEAFDVLGNIIGSCNFSIEVLDTISDFEITCPPTVYSSYWGQNVWNMYIDPVTCVATANWPEPLFVSSGCVMPVDTVYNYSGIEIGDNLPIGTYSIDYYAYDSLGNNLGYCSFMVVVQHEEEDFITYPSDTVITTDPATCLATVNWSNPIINEVCGFTSYYGINSYSNNWFSNGGNPYNNNAGQQLPIGEYTIGYYSYNGAMTVYHNFTINVVDGSMPSFGTTCSTDTVVLANNFNTCEATAAWTVPTAMLGTCASVMDPISVTSNYAPGDLLPIGNTDIIYTATTSGGISATCSFVVEVIDTQDPVFYACPSDVNAMAGADSCYAIASWTAPGAFDNCPGLIVTSDYAPGASFPMGSTLVTYVATDVNGNVDSCSFTVNVTDNIAPVIAGCPTNVTLNSDPSICGAVATWTAPTATDNCSLVSFTSTHLSGAVFPIGTTTVTYTATDAAGLNTYCSFTVTVVDSQVPVLLNCPSDMTVSANFNMCAAQVSWIAPTAGDNCGGATIVGTRSSGDLFPIGTSTVTYYITDASGNMDSCSFTVTVVDMHAPQITACPPSVNVSTDENSCEALVGWTTPIGLDNCSGVTLTSNFNSGDAFPIGTHTVTYIATDEGGLSASCSFTITVEDRIAPTFQNCPSNIEVQGLLDTCGAYVTWNQPLAIDNCTMDTVISNYSSGSFFPVGETTVIYTAVDSSGMMTSCSFVIVVLNNNPKCDGSTPNPTPDPIVVPQAFTPDGDGINDLFVIQGIEQYPNSELVIFNRWGNEVYRINGYMNDWNGISLNETNISGSDLPTSTYFYVLDTKDDSIGVLKGFVYLQR